MHLLASCICMLDGLACLTVVDVNAATGNGDILYVRERPVKPQKEDGVVKCPVGNGGFHDAFKLDWESQCVVIKDLPSKEAKCSVRKRVSHSCICALPEIA